MFVRFQILFLMVGRHKWEDKIALRGTVSRKR